MGKRQKVRFYLVHNETGQRYPIGVEELVIGQTSGELLFRDDAALSPQHCRIFITDAGLQIHDLNSSSGTFLNGQRLEKNKLYPLKGGSQIRLGEQELHIQETSSARRISRRAAQAKQDRMAQTMLAATVSILVIFLSQQVLKIRPSNRKNESAAAANVPTPYEMVQKDLRQALDQYKLIGRAQQLGKTSPQQTAGSLRNSLLPALEQVQVKLGVVQGVSEFERRKLEIDRKMVTALVGQVNAMIDLHATKNPKAEERIQAYSLELEALNAQAQGFKNRAPAQADSPKH